MTVFIQTRVLAQQDWLNKALRTLLTVAPGLAFFLIKGDPLGVGFAFAALCLSVPYNDQTFRPIHLFGMAASAGFLLPLVVSLQGHVVSYLVGFAFMGAAGVLVTRSRRLPARVTIWSLIYLLYQSNELQNQKTAVVFALAMAPAAVWTYAVCFWIWPHRLPRPAKPETGKPLGAPLHAACAALAMASAGAAVVIFHLSHGNWAIWSAYTVIRARRQTSLQRSARRALGAVIGCATGFVVIEIFRDIPMILTALTLAAVFFMVAFENYVLAVSVRSCLAPLAAIALHYDPITTVEARFLGIAVGVILGTLFTLLFTRRETRSLAT
ncbi:MAG TPA: FUSC family protein [Chthoniobacterales bacterium]